MEPGLVVRTGGLDFVPLKWVRGCQNGPNHFLQLLKALEETEGVDYDRNILCSSGDIGIEMDYNKYRNPEEEEDEPQQNELEFSEDQFGVSTKPKKDPLKENSERLLK
ncbi:MAG: hypothetical protein R2784_07400 [Saprospiraceae bacterium]